MITLNPGLYQLKTKYVTKLTLSLRVLTYCTYGQSNAKTGTNQPYSNLTSRKMSLPSPKIVIIDVTLVPRLQRKVEFGISLNMCFFCCARALKSRTYCATYRHNITDKMGCILACVELGLIYLVLPWQSSSSPS